ncbi:MAG TPA: hypothetical protein VNO33_17300, partial [Kofleriaceae bacterium]|nr:hypothetical protein [Kofleriaceae bacterium]
MTPRELLDRLWRLGVGVDDGGALAAARAAADDPAVALELDLFAGWMAVAGGGAQAPVDPAALPAGSARVLARAIDLRAARNRRDVTAIDAGFGAVDQELGLLDAADPRGPTARAAVDLALAEVALMGRDLTAARRCLGR